MTETGPVKADDAWHERWQSGRTGFHQAEYNPYLLRYWPQVCPRSKSSVLVPLCGKSRDMNWLHQQGHTVIGVELVEMACQAFFEEQSMAYERTHRGGHLCFVGTGEAAGITLFCADLFSLSGTDIGLVEAWYDRASVVALEPETRTRYANWMASVLPSDANGLMMTFEYPQEERQGPPFSVTFNDVQRYFGDDFSVELLERFDMTDGNRWNLSSVHKPVLRLKRR